ncbi:hypothetical protein THAOC_09882 [Thalassiosira oceanica]|uniref:Uncharacterized protein n=1 Tax=Thalassiosira oceanica TaxID=159749 RepID=K0SRI9_THAOC|nr:hypothetical protein THAOC_09882 [Thalassiosira oceanica]|eukprot:EJK68908.1 hypothetical protein THAOC_09882 [Thalassiosira oceanica]
MWEYDTSTIAGLLMMVWYMIDDRLRRPSSPASASCGFASRSSVASRMSGHGIGSLLLRRPPPGLFVRPRHRLQYFAFGPTRCHAVGLQSRGFARVSGRLFQKRGEWRGRARDEAKGLKNDGTGALASVRGWRVAVTCRAPASGNGNGALLEAV